MKIAIGNSAKENHFGWTPFEVLNHEIELRSGGRFRGGANDGGLAESAVIIPAGAPS